MSVTTAPAPAVETVEAPVAEVQAKSAPMFTAPRVNLNVTAGQYALAQVRAAQGDTDARDLVAALDIATVSENTGMVPPNYLRDIIGVIQNNHGPRLAHPVPELVELHRAERTLYGLAPLLRDAIQNGRDSMRLAHARGTRHHHATDVAGNGTMRELAQHITLLEGMADRALDIIKPGGFLFVNFGIILKT